MLRTPFSRWLGWTALAFLGLLAWDLSGLDLPVARLFGTPEGFALRDNWVFVKILHEGAKWLTWALVILLCGTIAWPVGFLRRLTRAERVQLALGVIASVLLVQLLKHGSRTSCPWDLQAFGGVATHVSHWTWGQGDGGPGRCFPAGHASAAFAFLSGYFVLARRVPSAARWWLAATVLGGLLLGLAQQARGAHYMSHTLWTGWFCWATGLAIDMACQWRRSRAGQVALAAGPSRTSY